MYESGNVNSALTLPFAATTSCPQHGLVTCPPRPMVRHGDSDDLLTVHVRTED